MKKCMKKIIASACLCLLIFAWGLCRAPAAGAMDLEWIGKFRQDSFDLTSQNISDEFIKFMRCNAGELHFGACRADADAPEFLFTPATLETLRKYHIIMVPGGEYDFFSKLVTLCEGKPHEEFTEFQQKHPLLAQEVKTIFETDICPYEITETELLYDRFMDAYISYELLFLSNEINFTRLPFSKKDSTTFAGDRPDKISLLADVIEAIEAKTPDNESKEYILMGHSFGGLNISDFLVELLDGHVPGTPENHLFANTTVRSWPADKKERIFRKIKGVVLLNTFVQGQRGTEVALYKLAREQKVSAADPVEHYINYVLGNYERYNETSDNTTIVNIYNDVLRSNRYRVNYYLQDKNSLQTVAGAPIKNAFDRIAQEKAVIAVGTWVPQFYPALRVEPNFIVHLSKTLWRQQGILNDGMVDSVSSIIPRPEVDFVLLPNLDHGALVLKPQVRGITIGHTYDQMPFIKTLLQRLGSRLAGLPAN